MLECCCCDLGAVGHPGDGYTCPTPPGKPGLFYQEPTAVTEDGCKPCFVDSSDGYVLLSASQHVCQEAVAAVRP
jgi:hypothetical protein